MDARPLVWLGEDARALPQSRRARRRFGELLWDLQQGCRLSMPQSRPIPMIGPGCHELRVTEGGVAWRIVYRADPDAVVIVMVFAKKAQTTPDAVIATCRRRLWAYDRVIGERNGA